MPKLKNKLKDRISKKQITLLPKSFDTVGSIAIFQNISESLRKKEKLIAQSVLKSNFHIKTVLKKTEKRKGKYRISTYKILAGKKNTETIYKEHGLTFNLDPTKTYFSPRELTERQRIANMVRSGENVLVMFSGIAPFTLAIAKNKPWAKVYGIELNKMAHNYAVKNIKENHLSNAFAIHGDVRKILSQKRSELPKVFDRILMPLPKDSDKFLNLAFKYSREIIHFYFHGQEPNIFKQAIELLKGRAKQLKKRIRILNKRKVAQIAPRQWKIVIDIKIL